MKKSLKIHSFSVPLFEKHQDKEILLLFCSLALWQEPVKTRYPPLSPFIVLLCSSSSTPPPSAYRFHTLQHWSAEVWLVLLSDCGGVIKGHTLEGLQWPEQIASDKHRSLFLHVLRGSGLTAQHFSLLSGKHTCCTCGPGYRIKWFTFTCLQKNVRGLTFRRGFKF